VMVGGCLILESEGATPSGMIYILAPAASFEVEDTWYSNGLLGSGSHHYKVKDLFIPERHTFSLAGPAKFEGPLFADAGSATVFIPMAGTPLGLMRRAIEVTVELSREKVISLPAPPTLMRNLPRVNAGGIGGKGRRQIRTCAGSNALRRRTRGSVRERESLLG